MARTKVELPEDRKRDLRNAILGATGEGRDVARSLRQVEDAVRADPAWKDLPRPRFVEVVGDLKSEGLLSAQRKVGYWKPAPGEGAQPEPVEERAADEVPEYKSDEKGYYPAIETWLADRFHCYAKVVSERGKRGRRRGGEQLVAVPDVAGVRYLPGPTRDHVELIAVEVKVGAPTRSDISEAYRYSRFADFCYVAYDEDSLADEALLAELIEEAVRLGLGVIQFPARKGPGKRISELQAPVRQSADPLAKDFYLSDKLDIWQCVRCGTYHFVNDDEKLTHTSRSDDWAEAGALAEEDLEAARFLCDKCSRGL